MLALAWNATLPTALDADRMKTVLVAAIGLFIGFAVVSLWVVKKMFSRILFVGGFVLLAIFSYSQRQNLIRCADDVAAAKSNVTKCHVAGFDAKIPTSKIPGLVVKNLGPAVTAPPTAPATAPATAAPAPAPAPATTVKVAAAPAAPTTKK